MKFIINLYAKHAACNKHFRDVLPECNSGGKPTSTILMAIMNLIMGSVLMII